LTWIGLVASIIFPFDWIYIFIPKMYQKILYVLITIIFLFVGIRLIGLAIECQLHLESFSNQSSICQPSITST
jgi:hypothetical protein